MRSSDGQQHLEGVAERAELTRRQQTMQFGGKVVHEHDHGPRIGHGAVGVGARRDELDSLNELGVGRGEFLVEAILQTFRRHDEVGIFEWPSELGLDLGKRSIVASVAWRLLLLFFLEK